MGLQDCSNTIEGAICAFDHETGNKMSDEIPIGIIELLMDKYYFKEEITTFDNELVEKGFYHVNEAIEDNLEEMPVERLVKVLKTLHFVAKRRSRGGREYLKIVNDYVGPRIGPGIRFMPFK